MSRRQQRLEEVEAGARALDDTSEAGRVLEWLQRMMHCPSYRAFLSAEKAFSYERGGERNGQLKFPDLRAAKTAFVRTDEGQRLLAAAERELAHVVGLPVAGGRPRYEYRPPEAPPAAQDGPTAADGPAPVPGAEAAAQATAAAPTGTSVGGAPQTASPSPDDNAFGDVEQRRGLEAWFAQAEDSATGPLGLPASLPGPGVGHTPQAGPWW
jgi:hypothetical protein